MSNQVYVHIAQFKARYKHKVVPTMNQQEILSWQVKQTWVPLAKESFGVKRYYDVIREMSKLYEVIVLRNPHSIYDGITVVGSGMLVDDFIKILHTIINTIEKETTTAPRHPKSTLHLREYRANLKSKYVAAYIRAFKELNAIKELRIDYMYWQGVKKVIRDYIKQSPLKTKKAFR
jgi:hypothetical protein